ncbi:hypothetical protein MTO96_017882 [Rhipicephalus appendiculatus]
MNIYQFAQYSILLPMHLLPIQQSVVLFTLQKSICSFLIHAIKEIPGVNASHHSICSFHDTLGCPFVLVMLVIPRHLLGFTASPFGCSFRVSSNILTYCTLLGSIFLIDGLPGAIPGLRSLFTDYLPIHFHVFLDTDVYVAIVAEPLHVYCCDLVAQFFCVLECVVAPSVVPGRAE